jgi:acetylornithine deacetylase
MPHIEPKHDGLDLEARLDDLITESLDRYVAFLQELLRIPNPRMCEHRSVRFAAAELQRLGCHVKIFEGLALDQPTPDGPPINIFAHRPGQGGGRSLLLEAHCDTAPEGNPDKWTGSAWSGRIENGRIFARGAHDDRSGVAILCMVVDLLNQLRCQAGGDLYVLINTEEEHGGGGMRAYAQQADRVYPDAHLLIDGNMANECIVGHGGVMDFEISIEGPYGSAQEIDILRTANPIDLMFKLVEDLRRFEKIIDEQLRSRGADERWPPSLVAVTGIRSEGWYSCIPESCTASGFCNVFPPLSHEDYKRSFERFVGEFASGSDWLSHHSPTVNWGPIDIPAMVTPDDSDFFTELTAAHQRSHRVPLHGRYIGGWSDMPLLGCPNAILYGPGGGGGYHGYDEYYELKDLPPMLKSLVLLVMSWCGSR